jgi:hypothetical protein
VTIPKRRGAVTIEAVLFDFKRQDCKLVHLRSLVTQSNGMPMGIE